MKRITSSLVVTALLLASCAYAQAQAVHPPPVFPIIENGLWGYIDSTGAVVINPRFRGAGSFSEGLASVRLEGTYGYIDGTGEWVIPPGFDFALPFEQGLAKVYIDGAPYFIDRSGKVAFDHSFSEIEPFGLRNYTIVRNQDEKHGLIDRQGHLLLDTDFEWIGPFSSGVAVVMRERPGESSSTENYTIREFGVVDTAGNVVVPPGKYTSIEQFGGGYSVASLPRQEDQKKERRFVIDSSGREVFEIPSSIYSPRYGRSVFSEGRGVVEIHLVNPDTITVWSPRFHYRFAGVIDTRGRILFGDTAWKQMTSFNRNRAFVEDTNDLWYLIDRDGEILGQRSFLDVPAAGWNASGKIFRNGREIVQTESGWEIIDLNGATLATIPSGHGRPSWLADFILLRDDNSTRGGGYSSEFGHWNPDAATLLKPQFHDVDRHGYQNGLLQVIEDGRLGYVDLSGKYVWRENQKEKVTDVPLNIDYMNRGYFYASSPGIGNLGHLGGWADSDNEFSTLADQVRNELYINAVQQDGVLFGEVHLGMNVYVVNGSPDTLYFDAQDSRLYMKVQARDRNGDWRDIEYLPSSWCGNSYHTRFLPPASAWTFTMPVYEGDFKTQLRVKLLYRENHDQKEDLTVYSNEFAGSVNPGQFWRKLEYHPGGIMDPYVD